MTEISKINLSIDINLLRKGGEAILFDFKNSLNSLENYVNEGNLASIKVFMNQFYLQNNILLVNFEKYQSLIKTLYNKSFNLNKSLHNGEKDFQKENYYSFSLNNVCNYDVIDKDNTHPKNEIHFELKNTVIDKYIQKITVQDSLLFKQKNEIDRIKKQFEAVLTKNNDILINQSDIKISSDNTIASENKLNTIVRNKPAIQKISKNSMLKESISLSQFEKSNRKDLIKPEFILNEDEKSNRMLYSKRFTNIESDKINIITDYKIRKISQSPINDKYSLNNIDNKSDKLIKKRSIFYNVGYGNCSKQVTETPQNKEHKFFKNSISKNTDNSRVNLSVKHSFAENNNTIKQRNVNKFINSQNKMNKINPNIKSSSSLKINGNAEKCLNKIKMNHSVTPGNSTRLNTELKNVDKNTIKSSGYLVKNKKKIAIRMNFSKDEIHPLTSLNVSLDSKINHNNNKEKSLEEKLLNDKGNVNYSGKMLNKYYQLLDKINRNLEDKEVILPTNPDNQTKKDRRNLFENSSKNEKKNIHINENETIISPNNNKLKFHKSTI